MTLSKYVHVTQVDKSVLLYNTANEAIVVLPITDWKGKEIVSSMENERQLFEMGFSDNDDLGKLEALFMARESKNKTLIVTISMTQSCNLKCVYCSQNDQKDDQIVSLAVLDAVIEYIIACNKENIYETLAIDFFGGEPLLAQKEILYFKNEIEKKISTDRISFAIDTNGVFLTSEFFSKFEQLYINLTLSSKDDHDTKRIFYDGHGSYDLILANLKKCACLFNDKRQLRLRYNVDKMAMNKFDEFVSIVKYELPMVKYIEIAPIIALDFNEYKTNLITSEFSKWYTEQAIGRLIDNGFEVSFPHPLFAYCRAYSEHDIKVNPDGGLTVCSAHHYEKRKGNILELKNNPAQLALLFSEKRNRPIDNECRNCQNIFICGGKQFCRAESCDFLNYDLDDFLKKYYAYIGTPQMRLFMSLGNCL